VKYLCLGYHDPKTWSDMPDGQRNSIMQDVFAYDALLKKNGHCIDARALQDAGAPTLRFATGGRMTVLDGPFAETKEQLGGVMVLEADDLNHAIQLMSKLPCMRVGGTLEIRPINENI
jgi:hypothetical protein